MKYFSGETPMIGDIVARGLDYASRPLPVLPDSAGGSESVTTVLDTSISTTSVRASTSLIKGEIPVYLASTLKLVARPSQKLAAE